MSQTQLHQLQASFQTSLNNLQNQAARQAAAVAQEIAVTLQQMTSINAQLARENALALTQRDQILAETVAKINEMTTAVLAARQRVQDRRNLQNSLLAELSKPDSDLLPKAGGSQTVVTEFRTAVQPMVTEISTTQDFVETILVSAETKKQQAEPEIAYLENYTGGGGGENESGESHVQ